MRLTSDGLIQVRSEKTTIARCCLIIYSRRPRCNTTNSWDLSLSVAATWPGVAGGGAVLDSVFAVNGTVIAKRPLDVAKRFATSSVGHRTTSLTTIAGIVCDGGDAVRRRLPIRQRFCDVDVKLLSKIWRRRRRRRRRWRLQKISLHRAVVDFLRYFHQRCISEYSESVDKAIYYTRIKDLSW